MNRCGEAFQGWSKDSMMWLLKGCICITEAQNTDEATMLEWDLGFFVDNTCINAFTQNFLQTLKDHEVELQCNMTVDDLANIMLESSLVQKYMAKERNQKIQPSHLRQIYKTSFQTRFGSRRRLLQSDSSDCSKALTRGQRRELRNRTPSRRLMERLARLEAEGSA